MSRAPLKDLSYIGKIPCKGDFIQTDDQHGFAEAWNEWLQSIIAVSKEQLGSNWLDSYLTSPIWHFAISPNYLCKEGVCGTLIPSIDNVGRHYPFTLFAYHQSHPVSLWKNRTWCELFETNILEVLEDDFELEDWFHTLNKQLPDLEAINSEIIMEAGIDNNKTALVHFSGDELNEIDMLHAHYTKQFGLYSLWWTHGSDLIKPCVIVTNGLPQVSQFSSMLDGNWSDRNWHQIKIKKEV